MKKREAVKNIMTKGVKTLSLHDGTLTEAQSLMEENNIRHIPITSGTKLVGILSLTDIHRVSFGANFNQKESVDSSIFQSLKIDQVMKHDPRTVSSETSIKEVAEQLAVEEFHALPVVNDNNDLQGIVTTTDLINYLVEQY